MGNPADARATIIKGAASYTAEQGSDYAPGISTETVGSEAIFLGLITMPPGRRTKAHVHERHETAIYMISGDPIDMYSGPMLDHHEMLHPGDYLYIPANVLHVAVNRGSTTAVFMGSRNEATVNESVVLFPEMDAKVPE